MSAKTYLAVAAAVLLLLSAGCIVLSIVVDPYRMFGTPPIPGLTTLKPRIYQQVGIAKTYQLDRIKPHTVLLGNSRVENGFDPQSGVWPKTWRPVFNAGLAGKDLFMVSRMFDEALAVAPVKTVILEVDFPDFLTKPDNASMPARLQDGERRLTVDRQGRPNPYRLTQIWRDRIATTLSIDALSDSMVTLLDQHPLASQTMTPFGFNPLYQYAADVRQIGYYGIFAQKRAAYEERFQRYPHPDFAPPQSIAGFRYLARIIQTAHAHGVRLIIFIPPYHAQFLQIVERSGLWPSFEAWKRALVRTITAQTRVLGEPSGTVPLIDFSGYNDYTMEAVPPKGDTHAQTRWYWEPGHYKSALGDIMLKRLISGEGSFGWALTPASIDRVLESEREHKQMLFQQKQ